MGATKICKGCGLELPLSEYNKRKSNKDGLQDLCRKCFSEYNKKRYAANKEKFKSDIRRYKENNPLKVLETRLKTCEKNPTKTNARKAVEQAKIAGVLKNPQVCFGCGCRPPEHRIEAHLHDYTKPLEVVWLCTPCHRAMDAARRTREGLKPYGKSKEV